MLEVVKSKRLSDVALAVGRFPAPGHSFCVKPAVENGVNVAHGDARKVDVVADEAAPCVVVADTSQHRTPYPWTSEPAGNTTCVLLRELGNTVTMLLSEITEELLPHSIVETTSVVSPNVTLEEEQSMNWQRSIRLDRSRIRRDIDERAETLNHWRELRTGRVHDVEKVRPGISTTAGRSSPALAVDDATRRPKPEAKNCCSTKGSADQSMTARVRRSDEVVPFMLSGCGDAVAVSSSWSVVGE